MVQVCSNGSQAVNSLRGRDGHLEMVDQRLLPTRFEYLPYDSASDHGRSPTLCCRPKTRMRRF